MVVQMSTTHQEAPRGGSTSDDERASRFRQGLLSKYTPPTFWDTFMNKVITPTSALVPSFQADPVVPRHKVRLVYHPTPIEELRLPEVPEDAPLLFLKRDDCAGPPEASGNKLRHLEFLLADAIHRGYNRVVTAGSSQSNHVRQTAAACAKLHLPVDAVIRRDSLGCNGNILLDRLFGARLHFHSQEALDSARFGGYMGVEAALMETAEKRNEADKPYIIPPGCTTPLGTWGYIDAFDEIQTQWNQLFGYPLEKDIGSIATAVGGTGTVLGLATAAHMYNTVRDLKTSKVSVFGYLTEAVPPEQALAVMDRVLPELCPSVVATDIVHLKEVRGAGYGKSTTEELQFLCRVARETGTVFDRQYNGKALLRLWKDINGRSGKRFHSKIPIAGDGRGILFIHTGGTSTLFDSTNLLEAALSECSPLEPIST